MSEEAGSPDLDAVNADFYRTGRSDGHPVVPPTEERLQEMLRGTDLPPDHEIGTLGNREGSLTVQTLAINGIMAGCRPIHMPVLVAGAEALADPASNAIQVSVSTGSWAYFWLINGPVREQLDIGCDGGAFGPGYRANRVIGRALGLAYKNTALIHPGEKDMGVMGNPAKYSLLAGENEEASPWEPVHVTEGYDPGESTITLGGPNGFAQYSNRRDRNAVSVLQEMVESTPATMIARQRESYLAWVIHVLSPENAQLLADAGMSKQDVKEYLCENTLRSGGASLGFMTRKGPSPMGGDEEEAVPPLVQPQIGDPSFLKIPVIGGAARENAVIGPALGGPVTKPIAFPDGWHDLLDEYRVEREGRTFPSDHAWYETT